MQVEETTFSYPNFTADQKWIPTGGKNSVVKCSYCQRDITLQCRIHCAECNFELCGDCFPAGVEYSPHQNSHAYQVVDSLSFPIFSKDWLASEELLLLEGIEKHGMGNWKTISDYIGTKASKQVEEHYWEVYMGLHGRCLPKRVLVDGKTMNTDDIIKQMPKQTYDSGSNHDHLNRIHVNEGYKLDEAVTRDRGKDKSVDASSSSKGGGTSSNANANLDLVPGFIPMREDFEVEYCNDAEALLADLEFSPDDHPSDRQLKLQVIEIYNHKLDERNRRKRFVIDRGLVDYKKQQQLERRRSKEERELISRLRVFARFHSAADHEALVDALLKARKIRLQMEALMLYRRLGITTMEQARQYELDRKAREEQLKNRKQRESAPYLFETGKAPPPPNKRGRPSNASLNRANEAKIEARLDNEVVSESNRDIQNDKKEKFLKAMVKCEGYRDLSEAEVTLCGELEIRPLQYFALRDAITREACRSGILTLSGLRRAVHFRDDKEKILFDFFVKDLHPNLYYQDKKAVMNIDPDHDANASMNDMMTDATLLTGTSVNQIDGEEIKPPKPPGAGRGRKRKEVK